jgi:hypothetical protein
MNPKHMLDCGVGWRTAVAAKLREMGERHCGWKEGVGGGCKLGRDNLCEFCITHMQAQQWGERIEELEERIEAARGATHSAIAVAKLGGDSLTAQALALVLRALEGE